MPDTDAYAMFVDSMAARVNEFRRRIEAEVVTPPDWVRVNDCNRLTAVWMTESVRVVIQETGIRLEGRIVDAPRCRCIHYDFPEARDDFREAARPYLTLTEE